MRPSHSALLSRQDRKCLEHLGAVDTLDNDGLGAAGVMRLFGRTEDEQWSRPFLQQRFVLAVLIGALAVWVAGAEGWEPGTPVPPGLTPRFSHAMVYDSVRGRVLIINGAKFGSNTIYGETWEYDGTSWFAGAPNPPAMTPRWLHTAAFDSDRGKTVVFGGQSIGGTLGDTWEYDGVSWTPGPGGPAARGYTSMSYDSDRKVVVLYGGADGGTYYSDTWEWGRRLEPRAPRTEPSTSPSTRLRQGRRPHRLVRGVWGHECLQRHLVLRWLGLDSWPSTAGRFGCPVLPRDGLHGRPQPHGHVRRYPLLLASSQRNVGAQPDRMGARSSCSFGTDTSLGPRHGLRPSAEDNPPLRRAGRQLPPQRHLGVLRVLGTSLGDE